MQSTLDSPGHRVPRTKPTRLLHTWRPHRQWPFTLVLHLYQHQSSRNLHLQYLAKNQSTQCCQSLVTPGSDHPPVLEPHMVLNLPLMSALTTHIHIVTRKKRKRKETSKKKLQQVIESQRKAKRKITWRRQVLDPLRKGNSSTHPTQNYVKQRVQTTKPKLEKTTKSPPCTHANSPWMNACEPPHETEQLQQLSSKRTDRSPSPVRPVDKIAQHLGTTPVRPVPLTGQADATWETVRSQK
jgi:hypothetical protein